MAVAKLHFILAYTLIRRRFAAVENYTNGMLCCKFVDSTKFFFYKIYINVFSMLHYLFFRLKFVMSCSVNTANDVSNLFSITF